ncbi:MAG: CPBP family intramembrane glutamic endopeptidase [Pseudomonadota bacterium]
MQTPFERFVAPARAKTAAWRIIVGVVIIVLAPFIATFMFGFLLDRVISAIVTPIAGRNASVTLMLLFGAGFIAIGAVIAAGRLHGRAAATLFGIKDHFAKDFFTASSIVLVLTLVSSVAMGGAGGISPNLSLVVWLMLLPFAVAGVLVQTLAEELVFRGYLTQQLAARWASPAVWIFLPSALFAILHYDLTIPPEARWAGVIAAFVFALVAADITEQTGNLGAAWGLHFGFNTSVLVLISHDDRWQGLALLAGPDRLASMGALRISLLFDVAITLLAWVLCRRIMAR